MQLHQQHPLSARRVISCRPVIGILQQLVHHVSIDIAQALVAKRLGQRADNRKPELLPQANGRPIGADHMVELHRQIAAAARFIQAVLPHRAAHARPLRRRVDHVRGIGHVMAAPDLVRHQAVHAQYPATRAYRDKTANTFAQPVVVTGFAGRRRAENIGFTRLDMGAENSPDRLEIGVERRADSKVFHNNLRECQDRAVRYFA